jgi:rubrerythrin
MSTNSKSKWSKSDLQEHLKYAIDLEFWTIPFYITAYHAVTDMDTRNNDLC